MQLLTEKIKEECLDSEASIGDVVVDSTKHIADSLPKMFPILMSNVPEQGRRDGSGVWKRKNSHLEYSMDIYEEDELKLDKDCQLQATVLMAVYLSGTRIRLAAITDRRYMGESNMIIYDGTKDERFIKNYSNGDYKSGKQLKHELAQEIRRRGWVDN